MAGMFEQPQTAGMMSGAGTGLLGGLGEVLKLAGLSMGADPTLSAKQALYEQQIADAEAERGRKKSQWEAEDSYISGLDPSVRGLAKVNPAAYMRGQMDDASFTRKFKMQQDAENVRDLRNFDQQKELIRLQRGGPTEIERMASAAGIDLRTPEGQALVRHRIAGASGVDPSAVREWEYFSRLAPEQQTQYLTMKRANQYVDLGDRKVLMNQAVPGQPLDAQAMGVAPQVRIQDERIVAHPGLPGGGVPAPTSSGAELPTVPGALPQMGGASPVAPSGAPGVTNLPPTPKEARAKAEEEKQAKRHADTVIEDIDRAINLAKNGWFTTGFGSQAMSQIGGTDAANMAATLDTIGANISFDRLNEMRKASPTGGALGSITEKELELLKASAGAIKQSQSQDQLVYNLKRYSDLQKDIIHGPGVGTRYLTKPGGGQGSAAPSEQQNNTSIPQPPAGFVVR